jgi:hypothetical protein
MLMPEHRSHGLGLLAAVCHHLYFFFLIVNPLNQIDHWRRMESENHYHDFYHELASTFVFSESFGWSRR